MRSVFFPRSFWRWLGLALSTLLVTLSLTAQGSPAQELAAAGRFCTVDPTPLENPTTARSYGDPHINTYDGVHYSFQTLGEYILSQSEDGSFVLQARQEQVGDRRTLSLNTAAAMNVCGHRVAAYVRHIPDGSDRTLWIDGAPAPDEDTIALDNGGEVQRLGSGNYGIIWPSGDQVHLRTITVGGERFLNISALLRSQHQGDVTGLFGNYNRRTSDDLTSRDGNVIPARSTYSLASNTLDQVLPAAIPVGRIEDAYFDSLYRQFGDSWRVQPPESLFDYAPGQSTAFFTDASFPDQFFTLNQASPVQVRSALETCRDAGVEEVLLDGCVFDVAATGEPSFASAAANAVVNAITRNIRDRIIDEVRDAIPIPRFPF